MKPGRNDPCPCGSGKKYKKCCLDKDFEKTGSDDSLMKKLITEILEFAQKKLNHLISDAYSFYWDEFDPEEHIDDQDTMQMADINFEREALAFSRSALALALLTIFSTLHI